MSNSEKNLSFGNIAARSDGATPVFTDGVNPLYGRVEDNYFAFYRVLRPEPGKDKALTSANCFIGSALKLELYGTPHVEDAAGGYIAPLTLGDADRLRRAAEAGWTVAAYIDYMVYSRETKTVWAEVAFFAYRPDCAPVARFIEESLTRIKHGDHPEIAIGQKNFEKIMESAGEWFFTKDTPKPELKKGEADFKKRLGLTDKLVVYSMNHKIGCSVLSVIFYIVVIVGLVWLIFFR